MDMSKLKSKDYWCEVVEITPERAVELLGHGNVDNRPLRKHLVKRMAQDIAAGNWRCNGESIKFDRNGRLVDGQHRLSACRAAHAPLKTFVCGGLDPDIFATIDQGAKRDIRDVFRTAGIPNAARASMVVGNFNRLMQKDPLRYRTTLQPKDALELYYEYEEAVRFGASVINRSNEATFSEAKRLNAIVCPPSVLGGYGARLYLIDPETAELFLGAWQRASLNAMNETDQALSRLAGAIADRTKTLVNSGGRWDDRDRLLMIAKAWNAYVRFQPLKANELTRISVGNKVNPPKWPGLLAPEHPGLFAPAEGGAE